MREKQHHFRKTSQRAKPTDISISALKCASQGWVLDCECRHLSPRTLETRKKVIAKMFDFFERLEIRQVGRTELWSFLAYFNKVHEEIGGRWRLVKPQGSQAKTPLIP